MLRQRRIDGKVKEKESSERSMDAKEQKSKTCSTKWILKLIAVLVVVLYIVVPFAFYLSPAVRRHAVFLNYVSFSSHKNLSLPSSLGLNCTNNFYISSENDIKLGVWHVPPQEALSRCIQDDLPQGKEFTDSKPVFLYLHGNAGTRAGGHRIQLYKVLSNKLDAHVIAFDYRGYGDSTNIPPSEGGLVQDTMYVYDWLRKQVDPSRVYIWGHSLGTGVATAFTEIVSSTNHLPAGLILEAPFTKLIDAVKHHPLSFLHRHMPFFDFFFSDPIGENTTAFNSISRIGRIKSSLLILHAEDDGFVPFYQGKELYERALTERPNNLYPAQFVGFEEKLDYGHKNIYKDPTLPDIIRQFMENINSVQKKT